MRFIRSLDSFKSTLKISVHTLRQLLRFFYWENVSIQLWYGNCDKFFVIAPIMPLHLITELAIHDRFSCLLSSGLSRGLVGVYFIPLTGSLQIFVWQRHFGKNILKRTLLRSLFSECHAHWSLTFQLLIAQPTRTDNHDVYFGLGLNEYDITFNQFYFEYVSSASRDWFCWADYLVDCVVTRTNVMCVWKVPKFELGLTLLLCCVFFFKYHIKMSWRKRGNLIKTHIWIINELLTLELSARIWQRWWQSKAVFFGTYLKVFEKCLKY